MTAPDAAVTTISAAVQGRPSRRPEQRLGASTWVKHSTLSRALAAASMQLEPLN